LQQEGVKRSIPDCRVNVKEKEGGRIGFENGV
jgi:hypothetical protein